MPAPWDLEYECLIHERMREAGGRFNYEEKIWELETEEEFPDFLLPYIVEGEDNHQNIKLNINYGGIYG